VSQDGSYYSSRKAGDYIYLFSRKDSRYYHILPIDYISKDEVVLSNISGTESDGRQDTAASSESGLTVEEMIPCIDGNLAEPDCIYVRDDAESQLIISSVNVHAPDSVVDYMVLMNSWAQIYMSTEAIYLYSDNWTWTDNGSKSYTDIAKFSYKDGLLNGVGAVTVRGTIQDTFAISEGSGILRVLTTEWSENSENRLYLLDENLKEMGSLENIARGEEIYAARYLGNVAYFITYHNTDPLFAVDISDPCNPKMLGQLEITGFSDYLHPYGDGLLLGIGYETDPETSARLGVKLVMFDISDPVNLKVLDTVMPEGASYTVAADYYKSVLADAGKNLIGFEAVSWEDDEYSMGYQLYSWQDGRFVRLFHESADPEKCWDGSTIRGLYAGQRFYLLNQWDDTYQLRSYDMDGQFRKLDELVL
ncbi:MAG: beta-propeller domain-containing protein, partial [Agathobacter sp.]|nr:beta-propeller domain-containing protein [Agathobacter sp.]